MIAPPQTWIPPKPGVLKINIDGTYVPGSLKHSIACINRNTEGRLLGGFAKEIRASSPLMAETLALWEALTFLFPKRHEVLLLESDGSQLVKAMNSSQQFSWEVQPIISKCKEKLQTFSKVQIAHCSR
ncbi:hypothetical protein ACJRO7_027284 [Eucalyptus globulus]|uniref:RNase H type-1 domain-containing protein n=1 Tax=Eucalyptus globulus TaxID=34317 RepID=A0ABD3JVE6_EUCGL